MKPVLQALLLADRVYEDKSGKKIIAGTFDKVIVNRKGKVPESHPTDPTKKRFSQPLIDSGSPFAYVSLTDVPGLINVSLQFVDVTENKVLVETNVKIDCKSRLATVEFSIPLLPLAMIVGKAGTYSLDLVYEGEILGSHRVIAVDVTDEKPGEKP